MKICFFSLELGCNGLKALTSTHIVYRYEKVATGAGEGTLISGDRCWAQQSTPAACSHLCDSHYDLAPNKIPKSQPCASLPGVQLLTHSKDFGWCWLEHLSKHYSLYCISTKYTQKSQILCSAVIRGCPLSALSKDWTVGHNSISVFLAYCMPRENLCLANKTA